MTIANDRQASESGPRWWRRRPAVGVAASLATGSVAMWIASMLAPKIVQPFDTLAYLVSLPIALLLPAGALSAGLIGWQAWQSSTGTARTALALPAFAAVSANSMAIAIFVHSVAGWLLR